MNSTAIRRSRVALAAAVASVAMFVSPGVAPAQTQPATTVAATAPVDGRLQVTVTGVEGLVQVREAEDRPWQKAAVGMVLDDDTEGRLRGNLEKPGLERIEAAGPRALVSMNVWRFD